MKAKVGPRQRKLYGVHIDLWRKIADGILCIPPVFDLGSGGADGSGKTVVLISLLLTFMCGLNLVHMVIPTGGSQFTCQVGICTGNRCCLMLRVRSPKSDRPSCSTPLIQGEGYFGFFPCPS